MKKRNFICLFFTVFLSLFYNSLNAEQLYYREHAEKGFEATVKEVERGSNYSILEVTVIDPDPQGGPFAIIAAAASIGSTLNESHFTFIRNDNNEDKLHVKVFFTSDTSLDPSTVFPNEMNQQQLALHKKSGYMSVDLYNRFFSMH
ncbi:MAG: hypothetical protein GJ680_05640 [Alteromonadaceae bacterium]|nr:hypothetical protein [Alteromonadaceae bacterium]